MQLGVFHGGDGGVVEEGAPFDAEGVHYEAGYADLVAYHEVGSGCEWCGEEEEEGMLEGLHRACWFVSFVFLWLQVSFGFVINMLYLFFLW